MPDFNIASEQSLGISHSGEKTAYGEYVVNLTDEEVKVLVDLIRERKTSDVEELELENSHPEIYRKLDNALLREELRVCLSSIRVDRYRQG